MKALFLGDVCPTAVTAPLFRQKQVDRLFTDTRTLFDESDFCFVNLECAITERDCAIEKFGPALRAPLETAQVLRELGVNCCGLSNNHFFDFGKKGAADSFAALDAAGIAYTGFGANDTEARRNFYIDQNGERIAVIAVCEHEYSYALPDRMGSRAFDEFETIEDIRAARAEADRVIVIYHGGKEHSAYPSPRLHRACHAMARAGADMILCQHSHCIGCYEQYENCHILYGQGNFHFVKESKNAGWYTSLAVCYDTVSGEISFIPVRAHADHIVLCKGKDADAVLAAFHARNRTLLDGTWRDGWHSFCLGVSELYTQVVSKAYTEDASERANNKFGHFLDCEAHTDVWRELFPTANLTNEKE